MRAGGCALRVSQGTLRPVSGSGEDKIVTALRYDEPALAQELASWCGGELQLSASGDVAPTIWVPTRSGPRPASLGDWIVRREWGDYYPCSPEDFAATHEPRP